MQFAPLYPILYRILKPLFPHCLWSGDRDVAQIALTFDDGPHPHHTPQLLDVLDRYGVVASFFWLGRCVDRAPEVAKAVWERGHWLGLHGYDHREFPRLKPRELQQSLHDTQGAIATACHLDPLWVEARVRDVRPPNGIFTPQTLRHLRQWQYRPVMWSVVPEDWVVPGDAIVVRRVLQQVEPGSLIVLHDGYYGGANVANIANCLIPSLQQQGYQFVTVDRLWESLPSGDRWQRIES